MEQDSPAYPPSASSSTTSRMATKQSFRRLGILSLLLFSFALVLSSCGGKSDLPGGEFGGFGSADLKQEVTIKASAPVQVNFTANTLGDSDIYRDGKLVSQSIYRSEWRDPIAKSITRRSPTRVQGYTSESSQADLIVVIHPQPSR